MNRREAIAAAKAIVQGAGLERSSFPDAGKARFAQEHWDDPAFEVGMEYGYLLCLIQMFELHSNEVWGANDAQ
jgi:hypothetical protein